MAVIHSRRIIYSIHKLVFLTDKIGDNLLQNRLQLTFSQFRILMAVEKTDDVCQRDIARYWDMTEAAVSRQIAILITKKFIARKENKKNRREYILTLTKQGTSQLEKACRILDIHFEAIYGVVTQIERKVLLESFDKLLKQICVK